ncbi:helix-turn-helix domain-containing protein [Nocardioides humi]|uniref:Helix-turn-helix domain-containing protein n=1 Tax=Nocardioides humi TaxID=449461 RepID=A0ABN2BN47_9ACTN|nr:helix-turn-helix domain-containing protein [Nocardioides humi]
MAALAHLLTVDEVAEILSVAPYTVRKFARDGALRPVRLAGSQRLRFRPEDVSAFIEASVS